MHDNTQTQMNEQLLQTRELVESPVADFGEKVARESPSKANPQFVKGIKTQGYSLFFFFSCDLQNRDLGEIEKRRRVQGADFVVSGPPARGRKAQ
jgi:hypothetical protein